jgi:hypothetical protein
MKEWSVGLEFTAQRGAVEPDTLFELIEALEDHHAGAASISPDGTRIGVDLWVEAPSLRGALATSERAVLRALASVGLAGMSITAADVKPWAELEAELARPNYPELVGVAELAEILGVSKQRISELATTAKFPRPLAELKGGPVWDRSSIGNFLQTWQRKPGRPRKETAAASRPLTSLRADAAASSPASS